MHAPLPSPLRLSLTQEGVIEGYASLFGAVDSARDLVMPGAFTQSLRTRNVRRVPMLFQHDPAQVIGIWDELREDMRGLFARGRLIPDVQRSRELLALLRNGAIDGLSIGYRTVRARIDAKTRVRRLYQVDLWEVSLVTFPLLDGARVLAVKQSPQLRADAARWVRPDAARFLKPGMRLAEAYPALALKYSPNQPRVPAGQTGGGQWTSGGSGRPRVIIDTTEWDNGGEPETSLQEGIAVPSLEPEAERGAALDRIFAAHDEASIYDPPIRGAERVNDPRVMSDADPEPIKPGQQYAQVGRNRGGGSVRINGRAVELSPRQAVELEVAQARAEESIARVRELDPKWKPTPSAYESPDGLIRSYQASSVEARQRLQQLAAQGIGPGPFAAGSIPARDAQRRYSAEEIQANNRNGYESGCHTCGTRNPGTRSENFVLDHQKPTALNSQGQAQRLFPQCLTCSSRQGGYISSLKRSW